MKIVLFEFVIHFGGGPQLAADIAKVCQLIIMWK